MKPIKAVALAAAVAIVGGGTFSGIASADPTTPAPAPPPPGVGAPPPGVAAPAAPAVPATTMDHDGIFIVGTDIEPGTYASAGPVEDGTCYWKRMADLHGGDIIDNAISKKPQAVQIDATDKAFKTSGCQAWQKTDAVAAGPPATGDIPALVAKAKLWAWLNSLNNNARQFDGSQVPLP
ncbi:hypothetical protein H7J87_33805 [Mycolicibacterium wolinskyi]|uniref:Lipoprotein n=1 Tax=Mycolicibacterium wolinskyi TaxID=59750 RepID=A0A1X2ESE5_9MYCO|nr:MULTISPECIES: hypothetical protein [Mycolicibacterium]MCV7290314.1 hypothetical protein [Mycolicibacterium wolinskyi]MCV7297687.1 hypothetical protein [Mycolicibacterium goodii]ORX08928.1 hypothetical protein AWC31_10540 [Mycolicibacterium wolinskyi]